MGFSSSWKLWFNALITEGLFFLGLGLGWAFGLHSSSPGPMVWVLAGCGLLGLFAAAGLWLSTRKKASAESLQRGFTRPVDLEEGLRSSRVYGNAIANFDEKGLRSEVIALTGRRRFEPEAGETKLIVEHWGGGDVEVKHDDRVYALGPRQLLRLDLGSHRNLDVDLGSNSFESAELVLHFLSQDSGLE